MALIGEVRLRLRVGMDGQPAPELFHEIRAIGHDALRIEAVVPNIQLADQCLVQCRCSRSIGTGTGSVSMASQTAASGDMRKPGTTCSPVVSVFVVVMNSP